MEDYSSLPSKKASEGEPSRAPTSTPVNSGVDSSNTNKVYRPSVVSLDINAIESVYNSISVRPGLTSDVGKKELTCFQFRTEPDGKITVAIPKNLESFADNWIVKVAVAAGYVVGAQFVSTINDVTGLDFVKDYKEYLHGVAAALKQSKEEGGVEPDRTSGQFHQGYNWVVSRYLSKLPDKELYRTNYTSLWMALTGSEVWNAQAADWKKALYQLVVLAGQKISVPQPLLFAKSFESVTSSKFTKEWSWQKRALFSDFEIKVMNNFIQKPLDNYNKWLRDAKVRWSKEAPMILKEYSGISEDLRKYDRQLQGICLVRANNTYRTSQRGKKVKIPPGLTREQRLEYLSLACYIGATNPTGLQNDNRIECQFPANSSDEDVATIFLERYERIFVESPTIKDLINPWLNDVTQRCKLLVGDISKN